MIKKSALSYFKKAALFIGLCMVFTLFLSCSQSSDPVYTGEASDVVIIKVKGYDTPIKVQLCPDDAPITVANFKINVENGVYDGTLFHRVIKNFMIQGGDPTTAGKDKTQTITGEFSANGVENNLKHERGTISMARSYDNDSGSSQFFICHVTENCSHLDGQYAAFGYVLSGMETVDTIASVTTDYNDRPMIDVVIEYIVFEENYGK